MLEYAENFVQQPKTEEYFDMNYVFDSSLGFHVAFGLQVYEDEDKAWDETYGRMIAT